MENNNESKERVRQMVKKKIAISNIRDEIIRKNEKNKKIIYGALSACASLVLVSGIAFAINSMKVNDYYRGLGQGVKTAIENGYVANPEMDFIKFDDIGTEIKIENFFMDDTNLSVKFSLKFDNNIESIVDLKNVYELKLDDLIVKDEENRIIYTECPKKEFERYCKENNLDYELKDFNENYMNWGLNCFIEKKEENSITIIYNICSNRFPKSKKLYFSLKTIMLHMIPFEQETEYELNGDWNVEVDVPENMYNRTNEYYKVVSCDNKDFNVYAAILTDTGFEIGVITPTKKKNKSIISSINSYVENENGDKFNLSLSVSRKVKNDFLDGNKYDFYDTFSMTKYDATDKLKVVLNYYGKPVTIELEK